ncbi:hypothetical protein [Metabacillus fastidiosus]|uniref:Uncharacterized protein n=1 Tax=Metabacillus fastidiosus TaxID=1458 RepID=A0ABU6NWN2_9BACI|nr:hypothetical protein [Metabacillus fastidiosus]
MTIDYEVPSSVLNSLYACKGNLAPVISRFNPELFYVEEGINHLINNGFSNGLLLSFIIFTDKKLNSRQVIVKLNALNKTARKLNFTIEDFVKLIIFHIQQTDTTITLENIKLEVLFDYAISFFVHNYRTNPEGIFALINRLNTV